MLCIVMAVSPILTERVLCTKFILQLGKLDELSHLYSNSRLSDPHLSRLVLPDPLTPPLHAKRHVPVLDI